MNNTNFVCSDRFISQEENLQKMINVLDNKKSLRVGTDSLGHSENNAIQEHYKRLLIKHYGNRLEITKNNGAYSYSYNYKLN